MLGNGKVTDTVYHRSVQKILGGWPVKDGCKMISARDGCRLLMDDNSVCSASAAQTGYDRDVGACAVHQAVNRLAASGGEAYAVMIQVILPDHAEESQLKAINASAAAACRYLKIAAGPCDAFGVSGMKEPVVTATAIGKAAGLFQAESARADQDLIMTGYTGWRGSVRLARQYQDTLEQHFNPAFLAGMLETEADAADFSCMPAVEAAAKAGVRTMYASGEGGIFAAVWEMAEAAGLGARIHLKDILLRQETVEICDYFGISPYQLLTEGALLLAVDHGQKVLAELAGAGIPAVIIGHLTDDNDRVVMNEEEVRYLEPFRQDSIYLTMKAQEASS